MHNYMYDYMVLGRGTKLFSASIAPLFDQRIGETKNLDLAHLDLSDMELLVAHSQMGRFKLGKTWGGLEDIAL